MKAVGHAWSVFVRRKCPALANHKRMKLGLPYLEHWWRGGTLYNYGLEPPHYPVPAIATHCSICGVAFSCDGWDCLFSRIAKWCALTAYDKRAYN